MSSLAIIMFFGGDATPDSGGGGTTDPTPLLIISTGESNSGGIAPNSSASGGETGTRALPILNNTTLEFQPLNIGVNNLLGHHGLESYAATSHGIELQLANRYDAGAFDDRPVYLVKTGQGASRIADWNVGASTTYSGSTAVNNWQVFQDRVTAAINEITATHGQAPEIKIFYSQGINDILAGTNSATWKTATLAHIAKIRTFLGNAEIGMTNFYTSSGMDAYNSKISEVVSEIGNAFLIDTNGRSNDGAYHWMYTGMKGVANDFVDGIL